MVEVERECPHCVELEKHVDRLETRAETLRTELRTLEFRLIAAMQTAQVEHREFTVSDAKNLFAWVTKLESSGTEKS